MFPHVSRTLLIAPFADTHPLRFMIQLVRADHMMTIVDRVPHLVQTSEISNRMQFSPEYCRLLRHVNCSDCFLSIRPSALVTL